MGWRLREVDSDASTSLARSLDISELLARLMVIRGVADEQAASRFLAPRLQHLSTPEQMADLQPAVRRLCRAIADGELVGVFGDYDVDGVTSAAIVADYLQRAGARITVRSARRDEGYGFGVGQAEEMMQRQCAVLVLTDCGTSDREAVARASDRGLDVIAVDHHRVAELDWPGLGLINPHRPDCGFPYKGLCSAGLAFYVTAALRRELDQRGMDAPDPREALDLVALGTLADVAPMDGDNRVLVDRGLRMLAQTPRPGLRELMRLCDLQGKAITAEHVLWRLGPRLNAPGRLGDASIALRCLWSAEAEQARECARRCDEINEQRKGIQQQVLDEAREQIERDPQRSFHLVAGAGWHPGVVGIVAAKLTEAFGRPAAVVALDGDTGRGSARTVEGIDLFALLQQCGDLMQRFGGHAAAAGFSVARERIDALRDALDRAASAVLAEATRPPLLLDSVVALDDVDFRLCETLARLGPHGDRNPAPVLGAARVRVETVRPVGADHLILGLRQSGGQVRQSIGFGMLSKRPSEGDHIDVAFVPEIDDYRGPRLRLRLIDFVKAGQGIEAGI